MRIAVFSSKPHDLHFLQAADAAGAHAFSFLEERLSAATAPLVLDAEAVCIFVNDQADAAALEALATRGIRLLLLRCAGFNQVDLAAAARLGFDVRRVPSYSPYAVAEHTLALILTLNRKTHRAYNRVREGNFALEGLLGFDLHGCTIGIIGTGKIGVLTARPLLALGCRVLGFDPFPSAAFTAAGGEYVSLDQLFAESRIISLHCPLTPRSHHLINAATLAQMQRGVMIINTSRGALIDADAVIAALKTGHVGYVGLDVYEQEADVFYQDLSNQIIQDDTLQRLMTFPNVLITSHQAFFTDTALRNIAATTLGNITDFLAGKPSPTQVKLSRSP